MAKLNKNNFLIWQGQFAVTPPVVQAIDDAVSVPIELGYIDLSPLSNDIASFGINYASLEVTLHDNVDVPPVWDSVGRSLRYYFPPGPIYNTTRVLKYRFRDNTGTLSNEATISVFLELGRPRWRGYPASLACVQALGVNTGMAAYGQLELGSTFNGTFIPVDPQELKANDPGDPDYIAPALDYALCPVPAPGKTLRVYNRMPGYIIKQVKIEHVPAQVYVINMAYDAVGFEELTVEAGTVLQVTVTIAHPSSGYYIDSLLKVQPGAGGTVDQQAFIDKTVVSPPDQDYLFFGITWGTGSDAGSIVLAQ